MMSIDSLLHIVVFAALFSSSSIFVNSTYRRRIETSIFYKDANSYLKLKARIGETIDIPIVCPQSIEKQAERGPVLALIRQVDFRQFDNCANKSVISAYRNVGRFKCEGSMMLQTAKFAVKLVDYPPKQYEVEFEEGKEYFFISTSGPRRPHCEGFFIPFSITIED